MTPSVRPARPGDAAVAQSIAEAAYGPYVPLIGRKPIPMLADFDAQISQGIVHVAVDDNGDVAGFVVFYPKDGVMLLENVAVSPEAAGMGMGRALIAACEAEAQRLGLPAVVLYTNAKMAANLEIYRHLGFVEIDRRHEHGFDRVYYEKRLS